MMRALLFAVAGLVSQAGLSSAELKLPVMTPNEFNEQVTRKLGDKAMVWSDLNNDGTFLRSGIWVDLNEFSGSAVGAYVIRQGELDVFSRKFLDLYGELAESLRRSKVAKELSLTFVETEVTRLGEKLKMAGVRSEKELALYRQGLKGLLKAAPILKRLYQKGIGMKLGDAAKAATAQDKELFTRYGQPWCLADHSRFCVSVTTFPPRSSGVMPAGIGCAKAQAANNSPFEALVKDGQKLKAVPYSVLWAKEHRAVAAILRQAATTFAKIPAEVVFAEHLRDLASAFVSPERFPYAQSDVSWAKSLVSDSRLFLRMGPDEVGGDALGDSCETWARYHFNLGVRNPGVRDIVEKVEPVIPLLEQKFARLIGDPDNYVPRKIQVQLPTFLDVIYSNGDDVGGPNGAAIGQTLPNWCGKDGKGQCDRGTMVYVNHTLKAYSRKLMDAYIMPLFEKSLVPFLNPRKGLDSVVYHELFHNLGPRKNVRKPNSEHTYGDNLTTSAGVSWKGPIEELKAQTGSLYMANEFYKEALDQFESRKISAEEFQRQVRSFKEHVIYDLAWAFRMIVRGSQNSGEFNPSSPYSKLAAVQVGFLVEQRALSFDDKSKKWSVNFEKVPDAVMALARKVGQLYGRSDVNAIEEFFLHYMKGDGEKLLHRDVLMAVAGAMPSVIFDYKIKD